MMAFLCCMCEHRFTEGEAVTRGVFVEYSCPKCGSDDVEDATNLDTIQTMKREARVSP